MFTGIVEEIAKVAKIVYQNNHNMQITILAKQCLNNIKIGDSVLVNGICLTVISYNNSSITVEVMTITFRNTNLHKLLIGELINLERALQLTDRLNGHIVTGHIDGVGVITNIQQSQNAKICTIKLPQRLLSYCVLKGSIAIDGISLTIMDIIWQQQSIIIWLIPHTQLVSTISRRKIGEIVNIECDIMAKYIDNKNKNTVNSKIDQEFLYQHGFL